MAVEEGGDGRTHVAGKHKALFREVVERFEDLNHAFDPLLPIAEFLCKCPTEWCFEHVAITIGHYDALREHGARLAVARGDARYWPDVERVAERHERYWGVEKIDDARRIAEGDNPPTRPVRIKT